MTMSALNMFIFCRGQQTACMISSNILIAWSQVTYVHVLLCCRYMVLFLKFIASVVPTIQYDYTMSVGG